MSDRKDFCSGCYSCDELCDEAFDRLVKRIMKIHKKTLDKLAEDD